MKKGQITERRSWVLATIRDIRTVPCTDGLFPDDHLMICKIKGAMDQALHDGRSLQYLVKGTLKELRKVSIHYVTKRRARLAFIACAGDLLCDEKINIKTFKEILDIVNDEARYMEAREAEQEAAALQREGLDNLLGVGVKDPAVIERLVKRRENLESW